MHVRPYRVDVGLYHLHRLLSAAEDKHYGRAQLIFGRQRLKAGQQQLLDMQEKFLKQANVFLFTSVSILMLMALIAWLHATT